MEKGKNVSYFTSLTKINSNWVINPSINAKITKLLEKSIWNNIQDLDVSEHFIDRMQKYAKIMDQKTKNDKIYQNSKLWFFKAMSKLKI